MAIKVGDLVEVVGHKGHCEEHRGRIAEIWECGVIILSNQGLTNIPYFKADELKVVEVAK